jgi:aspartate kinase
MQNIKVFKFGGASVKDAEHIKNACSIINSYTTEPLVVVISALGKTTNALEKVVNAYMQNNLDEARQLFNFLEVEHNALAQSLLDNKAQACILQLQNIYAEADWILHDAPVRSASYYYDQLVCLGELMSTTLIHAYYQHTFGHAIWIDVRDILRTDNTWQEAKVDWAYTQTQISEKIIPILANGQVVITQGFIGCTDENESTTLGREGSDYTAAIFANILDAKSVSIWKDVKGLLSGDPKIFTQVVPIQELSFYEAIEMTYYGAQVIHPKTIKPLHNKNIPLYVRCFLEPTFKGTIIKTEVDNISYPPILVLKSKQTLLQVYSKDLSFITDDKLSEIYNIFHDLGTHINIIQNAAISFLACIDDNKEKINALYTALEKDYKLVRNDDVSLLTIRHYTPEAIATHTANKTIILEQKSRHTIQLVIK